LGSTIAAILSFPGVAGDLETIRKLLCLGAQLWVGNPMKWSEPGPFGPAQQIIRLRIFESSDE